VHLANRPAADLAGWGPAVLKKSGISAGTTTFDLGNRPAGAVLLWITGLSSVRGGFGVDIADVRLIG
jgi:hypothetical protein